MACNGLKMGSFHLFRHPKWSRIIFGKTHFSSTFLPIFGRKTTHFSRHFVTLPRQKWLEMGSKMGSSHLFRQPKSPGNVFLKNTVFIQFLVAKRPIFKAFCDVGVAKMACNGLQMGSFDLFVHAKWS